MSDIIDKIIPKSDYEHRDGFDNASMIAELTEDERRLVEKELLDRLGDFSSERVDTLVIDTLAQLGSEPALPILRELIEETKMLVSKLAIATAIYQISHDKRMVQIAIELLALIDQHQGPYRVYNLLTAFSYLSKFREQEVKDAIILFSKSKEYLIAYNAKRYV